MKLFITIRYLHPTLNIGLKDVRNAWYFEEGKQPIQLKASVYQGNLYYRLPSGKRISYLLLKKGLIKKSFIIQQQINLLPF